MPLIQIRPQIPWRNDTTILAEDLNKVKFNTTDTVLAGTPLADKDSTTKYLELLGIDKIDKSFNDTVKKYENQYKLQSLELQQASNIELQDTLVKTGESIGANLGAGARADFSQDVTNISAKQSQAQQMQLAEQFNKTISETQDVYTKWFNEAFGQLTENGYENLAEYESMVDEINSAVLSMMADNVKLEYENTESLISGLESFGLLTQTEIPGQWTLTEKGLEQFEGIFINPSKEYGTDDISERMTNLVAKMTENYMHRMFPNLEPGDTEYDKQAAKVSENFNLWMQQNMTSAYYTHLDLAKFNAAGLLDIKGIDYDIPEKPEQDSTATGSTEDVDSINAKNVDVSWFGEYQGSGKANSAQTKYIESIINDIKTGVMPENNYFIANYGLAAESPVLYYYDGEYIYKTEYNVKDLPDNFAPSKMYGLSKAGVFREEMYNAFIDVASGRVGRGEKIQIGDKVYIVKYDEKLRDYILTNEETAPMLGTVVHEVGIGLKQFKNTIDNVADVVGDLFSDALEAAYILITGGNL